MTTPEHQPPRPAGNESSEATAGDELLAQLADEFLRRHRAGERPSPADYATRHPELAGRIRDLFPAMIAMEQPGISPTLDLAPLTECVGATIGRYKLLEHIGEGGFGVVFMAEQQQPVRRKVALKVIKPGMDSRQVLARFDAERQALAIMDHPSIAKVFDGGMTDSGRPYFVMELVKGEPITAFCDRNHIPPRERLELFAQVCRAVQHAHQKGIIHRDLKPSNVLVAMHDATPVVKVIDFGVAKALGQELTEQTLFTGFAQLVGTPLYMSPEQAGRSSLDVDTRSDIYSLGVLLYELLTGTTPFDKERFKRAAQDEIRRIIREEEPPRPSTRLSESKQSLPSISAQRHTEPAKLTKLVRGELDWIVMKALEKDRTRRYETANGLAMDVQRFLADEPVLACPPSAGYRLRKFVRRNKARLATASVIAAALLVAVGMLGWAVRDRSARQARVVGQVELILTEVDQLEREQKWPEALVAVRRAESAIAGGAADAQTTRRVRELLKDLEFIDRLEQARLLQAAWVGQAFDSATADRAYAKAFRDYGVDVDALPVEVSIERLKTRPKLAVAVGAALDAWLGPRSRINPATADRQRLIAIARGIDPEPVRNRVRATLGRPIAEVQDELRRLAESIDVRAHAPTTIQRLARSLGQAQQSDVAIRLLRDAQRIHPNDFWLNYDLGTVLWDQKDYEGAVRFYTAAIAIRPHAVAALNDLGNVLRDQNKLDEAISFYGRATEVDPKFVYGHSNLGSVLRAKGKLDEAADAHRRAIEIDPNFGPLYSNLGNVLREQKRLEEAESAYRKAIELDPGNPRPHFGLGNVFVDRGKLDDAVELYQKAIELDPPLVPVYTNLGIILMKQGKLDAAIAAFQEAIELDPANGGACGDLGTALVRQGKVHDAIAAYQNAIERAPNNADFHFNLGFAFAQLNEFRKAIECFQKAIELDPNRAGSHHNLGLSFNELKEYDKAVACFRKAVELEPGNPRGYLALGGALRSQQKPEEAIAACRKAIEVDPKSASAYRGLGTILCDDLKEYDEAIAYFRKAIELAPDSAVMYVSLGVALKGQGNVDEALGAYRRACELAPTDADIHCRLGDALLDLKKPDEAIAAYRKAIEVDPKSAHAYGQLGSALRNQKKPQDAIAACRKAIELDPNSSAAYSDLGAILCDDLQEYDKAIECFRKAIELDPQSTVAYQGFGVALNRQGKWDEAIVAYRSAIECDPKFADAYSGLGYSLRGQGKVDEAIAAFRKAIELDPKNASAYSNLGFDLSNQKKWEEAIAAYRSAIEFDPKHAHSYNKLAWLLATGPDARFRDPNQAVATARKSVELAADNPNYLNTLGIAEYRAGNWQAAIEALTKSTSLRGGGVDASDWFFLAMAHWQLGNKAEAHLWYDRAVKWMEKSASTSGQLTRFRGEATELLRVDATTQPAPSTAPAASKSQPEK